MMRIYCRLVKKSRVANIHKPRYYFHHRLNILFLKYVICGHEAVCVEFMRLPLEAPPSVTRVKFNIHKHFTSVYVSIPEWNSIMSKNGGVLFYPSWTMLITIKRCSTIFKCNFRWISSSIPPVFSVTLCLRNPSNMLI